MKLVLIVLTVILILGSFFFLTLGIYGILYQHHKIKTYHPVEGTVISSAIDKSVINTRFQRTTVHKPHVEYIYVVNGETYKSNSVSIYKKQRGKKWSQAVLSRYPQGEKITVFYNPQNPSETFLIRKYIFLDIYGPVFVGSLLLAISIALLVDVYCEFRDIHQPTEEKPGLFEIKPYIQTKVKCGIAILVALLWHTIGIISCTHYFAVAQPPYARSTFFSAGLYEVLGLFPITLAFYYFSIISRVKEARVFVSKEELILGDEILIKSEQKVVPGAMVKEFSVGLVCQKQVWVKERPVKDYSRKTKCYDKKTSVFPEAQVVPGDKLEVKLMVNLPEDGNSSSPQAGKIYANHPRYLWYIEVLTRISGRPSYKAKFPIIVSDKNM